MNAKHIYSVLQAVTEFHILLLFPTRLLVLNAVSRALVQDIALAGRGAPGYAGQPLSLIRDPATSALYLATSESPQPPMPAIVRSRSADLLPATFSDVSKRPPRRHLTPCRCNGQMDWRETWADAFAGDGLAEMSVQGEGRDMWHVHLKRGAYQAAFRAASTQGQRNVVNIAEADAALEVGDTKRAARLYGRVRLNTAPQCLVYSASYPLLFLAVKKWVLLNIIHLVMVFCRSQLHFLASRRLH